MVTTYKIPLTVISFIALLVCGCANSRLKTVSAQSRFSGQPQSAARFMVITHGFADIGSDFAEIFGVAITNALATVAIPSIVYHQGDKFTPSELEPLIEELKPDVILTIIPSGSTFRNDGRFHSIGFDASLLRSPTLYWVWKAEFKLQSQGIVGLSGIIQPQDAEILSEGIVNQLKRNGFITPTVSEKLGRSETTD